MASYPTLDLTAFGFFGPLFDQNLRSGTSRIQTPGYGGMYLIGVSTAAMNLSDLCLVDTGTDDGYKPQALANSALLGGIFVGYIKGEYYQQNLQTTSPKIVSVSGQKIVLLVQGVWDLVADGTINRGDLLVSSGTTQGRVITNNSAAVGTVVGVARQAATQGTTFRAAVSI